MCLSQQNKVVFMMKGQQGGEACHGVGGKKSSMKSESSQYCLVRERNGRIFPFSTLCEFVLLRECEGCRSHARSPSWNWSDVERLNFKQAWMRKADAETSTKAVIPQ